MRMTSGGRWPTTFRALRHPNYRLYFFGQAVSLIGTWMQMIAQQWLVYRLTGSAAMLGLISLVGLIPQLPLALWGGSLADRFPKQRIVVVTQTVMMVQAFLLSALVWTNTVDVWHVMALALVLSAANAIDMPARQSFVVELVEDRTDLTNAIALNSTIFNGGRAIGPAVAGVAVAAAGEAGAFFVNGLSFLAVIAALLMMRLPVHARPLRQQSVASHLKDGFRYIRGQQTVLVLMSIVAVSAFLSMPYSTLLPVFAKKVLSESAAPILRFVCTGPGALLSCQSPDALIYGLLMAAVGLGSVTGALVVASLPSTARRGRWLTAGTLMFPALLLGMALSRSFLLTAVLLVGVGMSFVTQQALVNTLIQISVPDEFRGRVMSLYSLSFQSMMRFGGMQAGLMGDLLSAPISVGLGALVCLGYGGLVAWRYPKLRNMA